MSSATSQRVPPPTTTSEALSMAIHSLTVFLVRIAVAIILIADNYNTHKNMYS